MRASTISVSDARAWDDLVVATGAPHIAQTAAWAELKAITGWRALRFALTEDSGTRVGVAQVLTRTLPLGISVAYAPRGPIVPAGSLAGAITALRDALSIGRCASLLCDPEIAPDGEVAAALDRAGITRSPVFVQPRRTLLMDLTKDPDALQTVMRKKTRQYIHKAERAGVVTEETRDLDRFLAVLRVVAQRDRFALHSRAYYERLVTSLGDRLHVLMARVGTDDVGAMMLARMGDRAWELYGGWSGAHDEARPFYLLKWHAMMRMRALGVTRYDMWGLAEGKDDPLAGVENFKIGFGGEVVEWIGAVETPVRRALYPLWQLGGRRRLARSAA